MSRHASPELTEGTHLYTGSEATPSTGPSTYETNRDGAEVLRRLRRVYSGLSPITNDALGRRTAGNRSIEDTIRRSKER